MFLMHDVALKADDNVLKDGDYLSPYAQLDIEQIMSEERWSVEHVLAQSFETVPNSGVRDDPIAWMTATRVANSRRSNHFLMLWPDERGGKIAIPNTVVRIDGELHFVPPFEQRARLARKWMYARATYAGCIVPPSKAQRKFASRIVALVKHYPIQPAERRVNSIHDSMFAWSNPLLGNNADVWLDDVEWRNLVFT